MHDRIRKSFRNPVDPAQAHCGQVPQHDELTEREREVLSLIARGLANKEIAEQLAISIRTVEAHRAKIMRKLGIHSHAGLIYYAMRGNISNSL